MGINHDTINSFRSHNLGHQESGLYGFCVTFLLEKIKAFIKNETANPYLSFSFPRDFWYRIEYAIYWLLLFLFQNVNVLTS